MSFTKNPESKLAMQIFHHPHFYILSQPTKIMKTKILSITLALMGCCFAEAPKAQTPSNSPEIQKIDARLAELVVIWKQDTAVINRLTNFKRTPVQQGSQAYNTCMQSSQRIQQTEAEAKTLKERRAELESLAQAAGKSPTYTASAGETPAARLDRETVAAQATPAAREEQKNKAAEAKRDAIAVKESATQLAAKESQAAQNKIEFQACAQAYTRQMQESWEKSVRIISFLQQKNSDPEFEKKLKKNFEGVVTGGAKFELANMKSRNDLARELARVRSQLFDTEEIKSSCKVTDFDVFCDFSCSTSNEIDRIVPNPNANIGLIAADLFGNLDPRNFLNPLETKSPTLSKIGAKIAIKGEHLAKISELIDKKLYPELCAFLLDGQPVDKLNVQQVYQAAFKLSEMKFYLQLIVSNEVYRASAGDDNFHPLLPHCVYTESTEKRNSGMEPVGYRHSSDWEKHPDNNSFISEWRPKDGQIFLAIFNNANNNVVFSFPPEKTTKEIEDIEKRIKLGEISRDSIKDDGLNKKYNALRIVVEDCLAQ